MRQSYKTLVLWVVLIVFFVAFYQVFSVPPGRDGSWDEIVAAVDQGQLEFVEVAVGGDARAYLLDGRTVVVRRPSSAMLAQLERSGGAIVYREPESSPYGVLVGWAPFLAVCGLWWLMQRSIKKGTTNATDWDVRTFEVLSRRVEVAPQLSGLDDAKATLRRAFEGGPRVLLLNGPPRSGKSALTEWLAAETGRPMFVKSAAEFVHMFVGVGAGRVRKFMEVAVAGAPCVIVLEDIEAIAARRVNLPQRTQDEEGRRDEYMQSMLQLKDLLDGTRPLPANVVFIATTSHLEWIDEVFAARFARIDLPPRA